MNNYVVAVAETRSHIQSLIEYLCMLRIGSSSLSPSSCGHASTTPVPR